MKNSFTPSLIDYLLIKTKNIPKEALSSVVACERQGLSALYVAQYEKTGAKDLSTLHFIYDLIEKHRKLEEKKKVYLERLQKTSQRDEKLQDYISQAKSLFELEKLFLPFKKRSNVKASRARGAGLLPLAEEILQRAQSDEKEEVSLEVRAKDYQNVEKGFTTYNEILKGVQHILSYKALCDKNLRKDIKNLMMKTGSVELEKGEKLKEKSKGQSLLGFKESLKNLNAPKNLYKFLQIKKAQKKKELKITFDFDKEKALMRVRQFFRYKENSSVATFLNYCSKTTLENHVEPSLLNEIFEEMTQRGEKKVLEIYSFYMKKLLSRKGIGQFPVLSVWTKEGHKPMIVLVGPKGELISHTFIDLSKKEDLQKLIHDLNQKLPLKALVMNSNYKAHYDVFRDIASSFSFPLVMMNPQNALAFLKLEQKESMKQGKKMSQGSKEKEEKDSQRSMVQESKEVESEEQKEKRLEVLKKEEKDQESQTLLEQTSCDSNIQEKESELWYKKKNLKLALFLARELQNPFLQLSQLCPEQSFGFPFSEIPFEKTNQIFQRRFEEVLLKEGLDVNEAPESLLKRVCGVGEAYSKEIVAKRPFKTLKDISEILPDNNFKQATAFLRLFKGHEILDSTDLHPRHYRAVWDMLKSLKLKSDDLFRPLFKEKLDPEKQKWIKILGKQDYYEILDSLKKSLKKRKDKEEGKFEVFSFSPSLKTLKDLKPDQVYWGQVQSVAPFGFFVDVGLDVNGFMPLSEVASEKIKRPLGYLSQGDWLQVSLKDINLDKNQFSLKRVKGFSSQPQSQPSYRSQKSKFSQKRQNQNPSQKKDSLKKKKSSSSFKKGHKDKSKNLSSHSKEAFNNPFSELQKIKNKL